MCQALRELMKDEIQEEIQTAEQKAVDETLVTSIKNLMKTLGLDAKAAMETLGISAADQLRYMTML